MSIDWDKIGQPRFDRIVEALINHKYRDAEVIVLDGRGGDGGIDIEVRQGDHVIIFQLKYFPEGFSGGFRTRRTQVERSYKKLVKTHKPDDWILVVPRNPTPGEKAFVSGLGKTANTPDCTTWGRKTLDDLLIEFPEVGRFALRDIHSEMRENAAIYNRERDNLLSPEDLSVRLTDLGKLVDSADPDWTVDFSRQGNTVTEVLRAQHPNAARVNPIEINVRGQFGPEHEELAGQLNRKVWFGTGERVVLPPEVVSEIDIKGPEHIARRIESGQVIIEVGAAAPGVGRLTELRFSDESSAVVASHEGRITHFGTGTRGWSVEATFYEDRLTTCITFPHPSGDDADTPTSIETQRNTGCARPREALDVLHLARQLGTAHKLEVFIEGNFLLSMRSLGCATDSDDIALEEFAADLDIVQRHCGQFFTLPERIPAIDRIAARTARIVIEGGIVASPHAGTVTATLNDESTLDLRSVLAKPGPVLATFDTFHVTLAGRELPLGPVWVFHHAAGVVNPETVAAAIDAGLPAGTEIELAPAHDPFFFIAAARLPRDQLHSMPQTLWELHGIAQPLQEGTDLAWAAPSNPSVLPINQDQVVVPDP